ncbi:DUF3558 domain-containing protein [Kibdelosporangium persicum]|uniref:DUF3558 family protein n=1 Tax=Kibdelosporangium persicum TaxID=2698649 RepID=UPI0015641C16|nr:DUF3558 family protein [Kibdelosporangium persicum]
MKSDVETRKSSGPVKPSFVPVVTAILAVTVSAVGCTAETGGSPTPGNTQSTSETARPTLPGGGGSSSSLPPTSGGGAGRTSPIENTDPCALLSAADRSTLSLKDGAVTDGSTDVDKGCRWHSSQQGDHSVQIDIYAELGTKDVQATGGVKSIADVGKHKAVQYNFGTTCTISLAITDSSRVDVRVGAAGDNQKACAMVQQVAQLVEPKLPAGS